MTRRLVLAMALLAAVVAVALAVPMVRVVANDQRSAFINDLEVDTLTTAAQLAAVPPADWDRIADVAAVRTGARVVVVDPQRTLVADSDDSQVDRQFDRPEIDAALAGQMTSDVRPSLTLGEDLRYVAAPVIQDYGIAGAVRLSLPESIVTDQVQQTQRWLVLFLLMVIIAASLVAWWLAKSIASPLRKVAQVAEELPDDLHLRADEESGPPEVRQVASSLNQTAGRLGAILEHTQRVAADASHHLRTPLTGIRLRLEAIEDVSDQEEVRADARAATAEVDRLARRIEQVLALARSDAGKAPLVRQDVTATVRDRVEMASALADDADIALASRVAAGLAVMAPSGLMARVLDELLGNALMYARGQVSVEARRIGEDVEIVVSDDGPGLPPEESDAVFERFRRGSTAIPGGSGLGLALVRESVVGIGGSASARRSTLGGFAVVVQVPATE